MKFNFDTTYLSLPDKFYTRVAPTAVRAPKLRFWNASLAAELGVTLSTADEAAALLCGNELSEGSTPIACAYAGHQFGHFNRLGDGRAILLGEHVVAEGKLRVDVQLKGAGRTPYSRGGDGRAALGPMLRESIMSEAMHALGVPTTRSLAVVTTGEPVQREVELQGAVLTRVASSHLRVGTFQFAATYGTVEDVHALARYAMERHDPLVTDVADFLRNVIARQAKLVAKWQLIGFIHGVLNTDNVSICGETIDYGPCAFMDVYDPATVFSSIDRAGRYAYGQQPQITMWNLARLCETLLPLIHQSEDEALKLAQPILDEFPRMFDEAWASGMRAKLGLFEVQDGDDELIRSLFDWMLAARADYTNTFRALTLGDYSSIDSAWLVRWKARLGKQFQGADEVSSLMRSANPAMIPRNHLVEAALASSESGDDSVLESLVDALRAPYAYSHEQAKYSVLPDEIRDTKYRTYCGT